LRESDAAALRISRSDARAPEASPLSLLLRRERGSSVLAIEPVTCGDLIDPLSELWFDQLRGGLTHLELRDLVARVRPVYHEDAEIGSYCAGFQLVGRMPGGAEASRFFPRACLEHVAARRARALIESGQLAVGDVYFYSLAPGSESSEKSEKKSEKAEQETTVRAPEGHGTPSLASLSLPPLLEGAKAVDGQLDDSAYPVLFTRSAFERAERISRKGASQQPAIETGALLVGALCACPETHEIFAVVHEVLEATDSQASTFSLTYSGQTWARVQAVLRARRAHPGMRHDRILAQAHGHNFLPLGGVEPCSACHLVAVCTRSSAHLSDEDRTWTRAVFHAEPWQLSLIFGFDARGTPVHTFYGRRDGSLQPRGYYLIDDFDQQTLAASEHSDT
jgi:hypothetical protein